jgi:hypothetical protein
MAFCRQPASVALASILAASCGGREGPPSDVIAASGNVASGNAAFGNVADGADVSSGAQTTGSLAMEPSGSTTSASASGTAPGAASGQYAPISDTGAASGADADAFEASSEGADDSGDGPIASELLPVAPSASRFAWQSVQTEFLRSGTPCTGRVAMSVSDHAVCYESASDQLVCAGFTYTTQYGSTFVPTGQSGVDQVILSATFNSETGNAMCIHNTRNQVLCFGDYNSWGQFGNGDTSASATWVPWGGAAATFAHIAIPSARQT